MSRPFTATIQQSDGWWIGWVEEWAGINCQAHSREELIDDMKSAMMEMREIEREEGLPDRYDSREAPTLIVSVQNPIP